MKPSKFSEHAETCVNKICEKGYSKDAKIDAAKDLCSFLYDYPVDNGVCPCSNDVLFAWMNDICTVILMKGGNLEVKRGCSNVLSAFSRFLDSGRFMSWMREKIDSCHERAEDEKVLLLNSIHDVFSAALQIDEQVIRDNFEWICGLLDRNNSSLVLVPLLGLCLYVAEQFPNIFSAHFEDVVDITVGWFVECAVPSTVFSKCQSLIFGLKPFWLQNPAFAEKLSKNFLEDIGGYVNDASKGDNVSEMLAKAKSVLNALACVLSSLAEFGQSTSELIRQVVLQAIDSFHENQEKLRFLKSSVAGDLLSAYVDIFSIPVKNYDEALDGVVRDCISLVEDSLKKHRLKPTAVTKLMSFLTQVQSSIKIPTTILVPMVDRIFDNLFDLRKSSLFIANRQSFAAAVMSLMSAMLSPTCLVGLQATYGALRKRMKDGIEMLLRERRMPKSRRDNEEALLIAFVQSLEKLSVINNSLIVVMGMQPSLFTFFVDDLNITTPAFSKNFVFLHYAILHTLYLHAKSHEFFVAQCDWPLRTPEKRNFSIGENDKTRRQVELFAAILSMDFSAATGELIVSWLQEFMSAIDDRMYLVQKTPQWLQLMAALRRVLIKMNTRNDRLIELANRLEVLSLVSKAEITDMDGITMLIDKTKECNSNLNLLNDFDMREFLSMSLATTGLEPKSYQVKMSSSSLFGAEDFLIVMSFLLDRAVPSFSRNIGYDNFCITDTAAALFHSCVNKKESYSECSDMMANWRWLLSQSALYCVESRMKTTFGKPMETLSRFSAEIQRLAKESFSSDKKSLLSDSVLASHINHDAESGELPLQNRDLTCAEEWFRIRCLLEFIELLEKLMYCAVNGAMYPICTVSSLARQFFVTNESSCREWLNRLYAPAMLVAYHNSFYQQVVRFGSSAISEFERKHKHSIRHSPVELESSAVKEVPKAVLAVISWLVRALVQLSESDELKGVAMWLKKMYSLDCSWVIAASEMAAGRFEQALISLKSSLSIAHETVKSTICDLMQEAVSKLRLPILVDFNKCPREMALWTELEREQGTVSELVTQQNLAKLKQLCQFGKIDRKDEISWPTIRSSVSQNMETVECELQHTLRRVEVMDIREKLSTWTRLVMVAGATECTTQLTAISHIATNVLQKMNKRAQPDQNLSFVTELDASYLTEIRCVSESTPLPIARLLVIWSERLAGGQPDGVHLKLARLARKKGNEMLAMAHLQKTKTDPFERLAASVEALKVVWATKNVEDRVREMVGVMSNLITSYEISNQHQQFQASLANGIANGANAISNFDGCYLAPPPGVFPMVSGTVLFEQMARTCMTTARWMQELPTDMLLLPPPFQLTRFWAHLESCASLDGDLVSSLLELATKLAPNVAKTHKTLADYSFDTAKNLQPTADRHAFGNSYRLLLGNVDEKVLNGLYSLLSTANSLTQLNEEASLLLSNQTDTNTILLGGSHYSGLWQSLRDRRCSYYMQTVKSYSNYLSALGASDQKPSMGAAEATMRIVSLLVEYSDCIHDAINAAVQETSEQYFIDMIPQLMARLSHSLPQVRETIISLLMRICCAAPHAMVYQLVGASTCITNAKALQFDEDSNSHKKKAMTYASLQQLEAYLEQLYPTLVRDVRLFVKELQRINVLYEERWALVLSSLDHEMDKRLEQIRFESEKTYSSTHLDDKAKLEIVSEKTRLMTASVFSTLEDLYSMTCNKEQTSPNEQAFVDTFERTLSAAFESSRSNRRNPEKSWAPFKQIMMSLMQKTVRRGVLTLALDEVSPVLAKLTSGVIPIPGQERVEFSKVATIQRIGKEIIVLPTKTRPKKMALLGSNGKERYFLLKGQEDLHLDERMMQLLSMCNLFMSEDAKRSPLPLQAKHYAVTPLGPRCGLIQWVSGATPLFHMYRKWQMRQIQMKQLDNKKAITINTEVERPTEMYLKRMRSVLAANSLDPHLLNDRSKWPAEAMREVLLTLLKETPSDLLSREVWMRSGNARVWWQLTRQLSRSCAVMSMVGSMLALGDRHLDNVLVDMENGNFIHIDYNICFDKGRQLRVPETVPFRLTQNIHHVVAPTHIEGNFGESCVRVLNVLRNAKELLLSMLEAFVYDPLVDWASSDNVNSWTNTVSVSLAVYGTDNRVIIAEKIARDMLKVRLKELHVPWTANGIELSIALSDVCGILQKKMLKLEKTAWNDNVDKQLVDAGSRLKNAIARHHSMMKDVRPLLRVLASQNSHFSAYLALYKGGLHDSLVRGHHLLDNSSGDYLPCLQQFHLVLGNIDRVYKSLLELANVDSRPSSRLSPTSNNDATTEEWALEEQNAHAKSVLKRVRARLEGHVDDNVLNTRDQVNVLIRQATSISALSRMYEGWTAWV